MIRTLLALLGILVVIAITYFAFFSGGRPAINTPLNVDLDEIKPSHWEPYLDRGLLQINIDHDVEPEWLFLYRDRYGTGQIGGVIYDAQTRPRGDDSAPVPSQVPVYLVPYKLLPDYSATKNQGYFGDTKVAYKTVGDQVILTPTPTPAKTPEANVQAIQGERLLLQGWFNNLVNRFAVVWWIDEASGYGSALAYTPGWFSLSPIHPYDWEAWEQQPESILSLWAWEPQMDRSDICRVAQWLLEEGPDPLRTRHFSALYDEGVLRFCSASIPSEPAFPEGQVLAYLLDGQSYRWEADNPPQYSHVRVYAISEPVTTDQPMTRPAATVDVDFQASDGWHSMRWYVEMIPPTSIKDPVRWRIVRAEDR